MQGRNKVKPKSKFKQAQLDLKLYYAAHNGNSLLMQRMIDNKANPNASWLDIKEAYEGEKKYNQEFIDPSIFGPKVNGSYPMPLPIVYLVKGCKSYEYPLHEIYRSERCMANLLSTKQINFSKQFKIAKKIQSYNDGLHFFEDGITNNDSSASLEAFDDSTADEISSTSLQTSDEDKDQITDVSTIEFFGDVGWYMLGSSNVNNDQELQSFGSESSDEDEWCII